MIKLKKLSVLTISIVIISLFAYYLFTINKIRLLDTKQNEQLQLTKLPVFQDSGSYESLKTAVEQSIRYLQKLPDSKTFDYNYQQVQKSKLLLSYQKLLDFLNQTEDLSGLTEYLNSNYQALHIPQSKLLVTGYFEAELNGSRESYGNYRYPIYRVPRDLVTVNLQHFRKRITEPLIIRGRLNGEGFLLPYHNRKEIDFEAALSNKADVLVWLDNPIDAFFLHIQGSGVVRLDTGEQIRVNYAGKNGRAYRAIGRYLINNKLLKREEVSMQSIRDYLEAHPNQIPEIFSYNPSYVFFREVTEGPIGNLGIPVTAYRSIATDQSIFPKAALALLKTRLPIHGTDGSIIAWQEFSQIVINQDTGGAIRGPNRVDLFTGRGKQAELHAGPLKETGELFVFVPMQ